MTESTEPSIDPLALLRPAARADPYPAYHALRDADPIHYNAIFDAWILTRYADVTAVLRDPRFSTRPRILEQLDGLPEAQREPLAPLRRFVSAWMLAQDPPDHTRLRAKLLRAFTPAVQEAMRPRIQALVDGLLDAAQASGPIDVIRDLADPLPLLVIAEVVGIPSEDRHRFWDWSGSLASFIGGGLGADEAQASLTAMRAYFRDLCAARIAEPGRDLVSSLLALGGDERLDEDELLAACSLFFIAGNETTPNLIGNGLYLLLSHPAELARLRADPGLFPAAIDELLRFESPVQFVPRVALEDVNLDGRTLRSGQCALLMIGAANRDPAQFPDPDRLDIGRSGRPVAFGWGMHACLGAALGRVEGRVALETTLRRLPNLRLVDDAPRWQVGRLGSNMRGLATLPVVF